MKEACCKINPVLTNCCSVGTARANLNQGLSAHWFWHCQQMVFWSGMHDATLRVIAKLILSLQCSLQHRRTIICFEVQTSNWLNEGFQIDSQICTLCSHGLFIVLQNQDNSEPPLNFAHFLSRACSHVWKMDEIKHTQKDTTELKRRRTAKVEMIYGSSVAKTRQIKTRSKDFLGSNPIWQRLKAHRTTKIQSGQKTGS